MLASVLHVGRMGEITIITDAKRRLIRARMGGLLTVAEVEAFSRAEQAAVTDMGCGTGQFDLLVETDGAVVQTQEVVDAFGDLMRHSPLKARRIATVRVGALSRMQTRRMARVREGAEVFETLAAAEAWLAE